MKTSRYGKPIQQKETRETIGLVNKTQKDLKFKQSWTIMLNSLIPQG
jgi:hypothetical protein